METHKTFSIRIPVDLFDRLETAVRRDGRSRNTVIVDALGRHLEFLRVVAEQSADLVATLTGQALKEVATNELFRGAAEAARKADAPAPVTPEAASEAPTDPDSIWDDKDTKP